MTRPLSWPLLHRQFGVNPAKANDARTVDNFRTKCLRELQKIQHAWPDLSYRTVKGALVLSPSPPRIAPSRTAPRGIAVCVGLKDAPPSRARLAKAARRSCTAIGGSTRWDQILVAQTI